MTSVLILLSGFDPGTYFIEDDGIPDNGIAQLRGPDGSVIFFNIPTEFLTITASAGRSVVFDLTESFGAAAINVGNLTNAAENPDSIQIRSISGAGAVSLVSNGAITESGLDAAADIVASSLILSASTGVGTPGNALETRVTTLEAETNTGGIAIVNFGNVVIGGLTDDVVGLDVETSGDLTLASFGSIVLSEESPGGFESVHGGNTSGNVTLVANGFDSDITSNVDQDAIAAAGGDIILSAGRDVSFGTLGLNFDNDVRARGSLIITTGRDVNIDGFADLASDGFGAATGGDVVVNAGRDINILNSTGTDGSLGAEGSGGGNTTLTAGPGGFVRLLAGSSSTLFSSTGSVTVNADRVIISATSGITAGSGLVALAPVSAGWAVNLGSVTDGAFALELSDAELDRIFTPILALGAVSAGPVTVSSAISPASAPRVIINSGTNITVTASITTTTSLTLSALDNVFQLAASTINTGSLLVVVDSNDDPGVGSIVTLNGSLATTSNVISGGLDSDTLNGTGDANIILAFGGNDTLRGFGGADVLDGGLGIDTLIGGLGNDIFVVDNSGDVVVEAIGEGIDQVQANVLNYVLTAGAEVELLSTTSNGGTGIINLTGNEFNQSIIGNNGQNNLEGGGGVDAMSGLGGSDVYRVDGNDSVFEAVGGGNDQVLASASFTLTPGAEVELLSTNNNAGTAAIDLTGNAFGQAIVGNNGNNTLTGGGGDDALVGLGGNDVMFVDFTDSVIEAAGGGNDQVLALTSFVLTAGAEVELLATTSNAGVANLNLTGNASGQAVVGNAGGNVLDGKGGLDALVGLGGADAFAFSSALGPGNIDQVIDMTPGVDKIYLDNAIFTTLVDGALPAGAFRTGAAAADADDRIIYDSATGALFYDADGNGGGAAIQFATLSTGLVLAATDFLVI